MLDQDTLPTDCVVCSVVRDINFVSASKDTSLQPAGCLEASDMSKEREIQPHLTEISVLVSTDMLTCTL